MTIALIVAMAQNHVIGINNDLPWHIPEDLKHFKEKTRGKPVIMGRKTFDSIFDRIKKPLPDRPNIVISRSGFTHDGVAVYTDIETALQKAKTDYPDQEIMIIGGASIYEQALPLADKIYLTIVEKEYDGDAHFPALDSAQWMEVENDHHEGTPSYRFITLQRK